MTSSAKDTVMSKWKRQWILLPALVCLLAAAARAQYVPVGRVSEISGDTVQLKGGADVGFSEGDVLVVQREGVKVALIRLTRVNATGSEAIIVNSDFGYSIQRGDEAAHELLRTGRSRTVSVYTADEYWEYPADYVPNFVELFQEKMPPLPRSDLDYEIERQKRVLEQQPRSREAMVRLADAYFRKDWFELAIYWYQRGIQEQPRAQDVDKLMYQIVRAYGALGRPDKQKLYMDYLRVNHPTSVFTTFDTQLDIIEPTVQLLPEWQRHPPRRVHMNREGLRVLHKDGMSLMGETVPGPIHGMPGKLEMPEKQSVSDSIKQDTPKKEDTKKEEPKKEDKKEKKPKDSEKKSEAADKAECFAMIVGISGKGEMLLASQGAKDWAPAELNACLQKGDKVRTLEESGMQVDYGEGGETASVKLNAGTAVTIGK
jgi:hypothetical protein